MVWKQAWIIRNYRYIGDVSRRHDMRAPTPSPPHHPQLPLHIIHHHRPSTNGHEATPAQPRRHTTIGSAVGDLHGHLASVTPHHPSYEAGEEQQPRHRQRCMCLSRPHPPVEVRGGGAWGLTMLGFPREAGGECHGCVSLRMTHSQHMCLFLLTMQWPRSLRACTTWGEVKIKLGSSIAFELCLVETRY